MTTVFGRLPSKLAALQKRAAGMAIFGRLAPKLAALRLSPLMGLFLSGLCGLVLFAGLFAIRSITASAQGESPPKLEWRPPTFEAGAPTEIRAASADAETLTRPVFAKSRRPSGPQAEAKSEILDVQPPTGLGVAAITIFQQNKRAFLVSSSLPEGKWLTSGEQIDGWKITDIEDSSIALTNGSQLIRLRLYPDSNR